MKKNKEMLLRMVMKNILILKASLSLQLEKKMKWKNPEQE